MALNLAVEFSYDDRPEVPVRLRRDDVWIDIGAMLDSGAAVSLFDAELSSVLGLAPVTKPERRLSVLGIGGVARQIPCWKLEVSILPDDLRLQTSLFIGLVPRLGKSTGNLLGRDFLQSFDFGLGHRDRVLYLGRAARGRR